MTKTQQQVVINAPIERVFDVIVDYERYPEFLPEMKAVEVLSRNDGVVIVRFELELIMRFVYTLRLLEDAPHSVRWSLEEAKIMSSNAGGWQLESLGPNSTRASYRIDVKLLGLIPSSVSNRISGITLPHTLARFKARAEGGTAALGSHLQAES